MTLLQSGLPFLQAYVAGFAVLGGLLGWWSAQVGCAYARQLQLGAEADARLLLRVLYRFGGSGASWCAGACSAIMLALAFGLLSVRYGLTPTCSVLVLAACALMLLAHIDARTCLLPDALTFPLLWLGLGAGWAGWGVVPLHDAVAGAMAGYGSLWLLLQGFRLARGVEGMGYGDLKLMAALGAWLGWQALPWVLLGACAAGIVFALIKGGGVRRSASYPFGPFLAAASVAVFMAAPGLKLYFY